MIFKCNNCGGVMIYSPENNAMYCEHCSGIETQSAVPSQIMSNCTNCGAPLIVSQFTSATKCEHCGSYVILEQRISGEYTPHRVIPFKIGKEKAKDLLKKHVEKNLFVPKSFTSNAYLDRIEGDYVPFWMYDYDSNIDYHGIGKIIRTWVSGNTEYTETSIFNVYRNIQVDFDLIPVDASEMMPDGVMDLMEPYDYGALEAFQAKYMSGYNGETYNYTAEQMEPRARVKADKYSNMILKDSLNRYTVNEETSKNINLLCNKVEYSLMPVWRYNYTYKDKNYLFYINGQTGKIVGKLPKSFKLIVGYFCTALVSFSLLAFTIWSLLEVL